MKYHEIIDQGSKILKLNKIKSHSLDSEILLSSLLNIDRSQLIINHNKIVKKDEKKFFFNLINRRKNNEPVSYITGYKEFWNNSFKVDKNVLIPRPDTEIIVEQVLSYLSPLSTKKILDIGTGSGCIIISIIKVRKKCKGVGIDISKNAIKLAKYNAKMQHIKNRIKFFHSDIDNFFTDKYDLVISNPPYIKQHEINGLDKDIKNYEPRVALNGGIDGYSKIRLSIKKSSALIKKSGKLFLEIGSNQVMETLKILKINGFFTNKVVKDLANKNRCVISTKI